MRNNTSVTSHDLISEIYKTFSVISIKVSHFNASMLFLTLWNDSFCSWHILGATERLQITDCLLASIFFTKGIIINHWIHNCTVKPWLYILAKCVELYAPWENPTFRSLSKTLGATLWWLEKWISEDVSIGYHLMKYMCLRIN